MRHLPELSMDQNGPKATTRNGFDHATDSDKLTRARKGVLAYSLAAAAPFLACLVAWLVNPAVHGASMLVYIPAISLAAFLGGAKPGAVAAVMSAVLIFLVPVWMPERFDAPSGEMLAALGLYASVASLEIFFFQRLRARNEFLGADRAKFAVLLDEQRMLFRDLQHRVANSMQFVASLLSLQKRKVKGDVDAALRAFDEVRDRVVQVARVHRSLYDPGSMTVPLGEHLQELCSDIIAVASARNVVCVVESHAVSFDLRRRVTLSLIVTEAVTNSLKHAFGHDQTGKIAIRLERITDHYILTIADNGQGLPPSFDPQLCESLGLRIMQALAYQIDGTLSFASAGGTVVRLAFPV
jgi:two-component sensor histidine kinase